QERGRPARVAGLRGRRRRVRRRERRRGGAVDRYVARPMPREDYGPWLAIPTRWNDNDIYGHVNNVEYYAFFDTVINAWLIREGGLDIHAGDVIGLCAESHCEFRAA